MKKVLLATAVAAMAFTSCSQNEEFENAGQVEIGFNSIVKNSTRATEVNLDGLKNIGFKVYAYNTGTSQSGTGVLNKPIMENESVTWNTDKWTSAKYYWPSTGNVQFFAYSSKSDLTLTASETDKYPTLVDYTVPASASEQEDLLIAKATDQTKASSTINFVFSHALTQVNFSIKATDNLNYTVSEIKLSGIGNNGTYKYEDNSWTTVSGTETYACVLSTTTANNEVTGTTAKPVGTEPLMLLPQTLTNAKVIVSYVVTDSNGNEVYKATGKESSITAEWSPGKKVRYTLELTNDATEIGWDVTFVDEWSSESNSEENSNVTYANS